MRLTEALATQFTAIALRHVTRAYPHKLDHVLAGDDDAQTPRTLHPIFYGSFDWHSCVHGYWTLARCLSRFPGREECAAVRTLFDAAFTSDHVAAETAYLDRPGAHVFERPYGWAWLLKLQAELLHVDEPRWARTLQPLADAFVARFQAFLPLAAYPLRAGVHSNTAFAVTLALDYAEAAQDQTLRTALKAAALGWYGNDADCQAWEPSLDEFLSPALMQAVCMRRVLSPTDFAAWFARFVPRLAAGEPATLFAPAAVTDRTDAKIAHLDGLNLSRAWCWRQLADVAGPIAESAAMTHLDSALAHVTGDYMGEHWLASFALLALEA